jgi:hypothetical protein
VALMKSFRSSRLVKVHVQSVCDELTSADELCLSLEDWHCKLEDVFLAFYQPLSINRIMISVQHPQCKVKRIQFDNYVPNPQVQLVLHKVQVRRNVLTLLGARFDKYAAVRKISMELLQMVGALLCSQGE